MHRDDCGGGDAKEKRRRRSGDLLPPHSLTTPDSRNILTKQL
jgi:hypothetical protein